MEGEVGGRGGEYGLWSMEYGVERGSGRRKKAEGTGDVKGRYGLCGVACVDWLVWNGLCGVRAAWSEGAIERCGVRAVWSGVSFQ